MRIIMNGSYFILLHQTFGIYNIQIMIFKTKFK